MSQYSKRKRTLLINKQNAMNAAEITDKLGLHSLRQRAWVCSILLDICHFLISAVHSIYLCYLWRWSLRRFGVARTVSPKGWASVNLASSLPLFDCLHELPKYNRTNVHTPSNLSVNGALHHESFWSLHFHFHKRRKGGHCTMNQAAVFLWLLHHI